MGPEREPEEEVPDSSLSPPPQPPARTPRYPSPNRSQRALEPGASHIGPPSRAGAGWGHVEHRSEGASGGYLERAPALSTVMGTSVKSIL